MVYKTPKEVQERKDEKRRHILDTAIKVFARRGYHGTSVKDIVEDAGISVGSYYFYFKSKEDLFEILYDEMFTYLSGAAECAASFGEGEMVKIFARAIVGFLASFEARRELAKIMMIEAVGLNPRFEVKRAQVMGQFAKHLEEYITELQEKGQIIVADCSVAAIAYIGTIYNCISHWIQNGTQGSAIQFAYPLVTYNMRAMGIEFDEIEIRKYIDELLTYGLQPGGGTTC